MKMTLKEWKEMEKRDKDKQKQRQIEIAEEMEYMYECGLYNPHEDAGDRI